MDITKFIISNNQYIKFHFEQLEKLDPNICVPCYQIDIDFVDEKQNLNIRFGYEAVADICYFFNESTQIQDLSQGKSLLSKNMVNDLGFDLNQFDAEKQDYNKDFKYLWKSNSHKQVHPYYNSWLYNDEAGNIIFEITPFYPWHDPAEVGNPNFLSYETWIKNYKPVVKTMIPLKNIKQWVQQVTKWCKVLDDKDHKDFC